MWECRHCGLERARRQNTGCPESEDGNHDWVDKEELAEQRAKEERKLRRIKEKRRQEKISYWENEAAQQDLTSEEGWEWLDTHNGQMWLKHSAVGKEWLDSEDGQNWQAEKERLEEEYRKEKHWKKMNKIISLILFILFVLPIYIYTYFDSNNMDKIGFVPKLLMRIFYPAVCYFLTLFIVKQWSVNIRKRSIIGCIISTVIALFIYISTIACLTGIPFWLWNRIGVNNGI
jgi:hypothetical protein